MISRTSRGLVIAAVLMVAACGGGSSKPNANGTTSSAGSSAASTGSPSGDCFDIVVAALNSLDVSRIDTADGIDDTERQDLADQAKKLEVEHPELASDSACEQAFSALPVDQQSSVMARVRPEVLKALGASARSTFSSVANSIN